MLFIARRVSIMKLSAKYFVLGHLYMFLYSGDQSKMLYNRRYLKYKMQNISFGAFKKAVKLMRKGASKR